MIWYYERKGQYLIQRELIYSVQSIPMRNFALNTFNYTEDLLCMFVGEQIQTQNFECTVKLTENDNQGAQGKNGGHKTE